MEKEFHFIPLPGRMVIQHIYKKQAEKISQIWVPRIDQERTQTAIVFHPGDSEFEIGEVVVLPDSWMGTDFTMGDMDLTVINHEDIVATVVGGQW